MGLLERMFGEKARNIPTEEERYAASSSSRHRQAQAEARTREAARKARQAAQEREEELARRRAQVTRAGGMHISNGELVLDEGWQFHTDKLPNGDLGGQTFTGGVAGLSMRELHRMAEGHGPSCRCQIYRRTR